MSDEMLASCTKQYPITETRKIINTEYKLIDKGEVPNTIKNVTTSFEWNYWNINKNERLAISPQYFFIDSTKYENYPSFKGGFIKVLKTMLKENPNAQMIRLGVRYINQIDLVFPQKG